VIGRHAPLISEKDLRSVPGSHGSPRRLGEQEIKLARRAAAGQRYEKRAVLSDRPPGDLHDMSRRGLVEGRRVGMDFEIAHGMGNEDRR